MASILIIENNKKLALFIQEYLRKIGYESDIALDGLKALKSFAKGAYDLLIVDMTLPVVDGVTVCTKVRLSEKGKTLPIIMISGLPKSPEEVDSLKSELKLDSFLPKPFSFDLLSSVVTKALRSPGKAGQQADSPAKPVQQILKGKFEDCPFEELLSLMLEKKSSGHLMVAYGPKKKKFFISRGIPICLMVSSEEDSFGNYLLKKGLVSEAELGVYKEIKQEGSRDPRRLFVNMGCLTAEEFRAENHNYLLENISECFSWLSGIFLFQPKPSFFPEPYCTATDMPLIIFEGFKNNLTPARTERFLGKKGAFYPHKTKTFFDYQAQLSALPVAYKTFDMLDGTKSCSDIISSTEVDNEAALSMIMTMDVMKMVSYSPLPEKVAITPPFPIRKKEIIDAAQKGEELTSHTDEFEDLGEELGFLSDELGGIEALQQAQDAGAEALEEELRSTWERIKDRNYYEVFGIGKHDYSFSVLKSAYFELTKKFSPDKFFTSSGEIMDLDQELLSKVTEAYEVLSNVVSKENYDEYLHSEEAISMGSGAEDDKMKTQVQFTSGKVFLEEGQFGDAEKAFTNLVNMVPDKPEYLTYLALAVYNNPANRASNTASPRAKELIVKSLKLGKLSMTYALKGTIVFDEGSLSLAEAEFKKALRINPSNKMALKKMKEISARREQEKKGVFKRMFK